MFFYQLKGMHARRRHRCDDNIKMNYRTEFEYVDIHLPQVKG
jgi:hypothetical protein